MVDCFRLSFSCSYTSFIHFTVKVNKVCQTTKGLSIRIIIINLLEKYSCFSMHSQHLGHLDLNEIQRSFVLRSQRVNTCFSALARVCLHLGKFFFNPDFGENDKEIRTKVLNIQSTCFSSGSSPLPRSLMLLTGKYQKIHKMTERHNCDNNDENHIRILFNFHNQTI